MLNHIAVDIGASSGRLVHGALIAGQMVIRELYRFDNRFHRVEGHDYWDIDHLLEEILAGLVLAKRGGIGRCTLGIDTWAVDYVLLDRTGKRIHEVYAYRDSRTNGAPDNFHRVIPREAVYRKTGIQELSFNTLYQLFIHDPEQLKRTDAILLVPDYLYFRLTGKQINELTNASTTQLLNLQDGKFDPELLGILGLDRAQFAELTEPGIKLGPLLPELKEAYDLPECELIVVPTHDTASAVVGVPAAGDRPWAYLSSGTWSLLGTELAEPLNTGTAMRCNYTNERGAYGTYRFLKNIMGLWMIQETRRVSGTDCGFAELAQWAGEAPPFQSLVACNHPRFLNPADMIEEIRSFCRETGQPVPATLGEVARCIFESLALTYRDAMEELERLTGLTFEVLHIVGGGSHNGLLNQLTADLLGKTVCAGPSESTAIGNLAVQMIACGCLYDVRSARETIAGSFPITRYTPRPVENRKQLLERWERVKTKPMF
ncbi:rhamnulokinase [Paenibacillus faecis]|uniref:rhamnulokinase n=1 Tax=Paenibacillus faecis TaxID=862114 RepID=UPI001B2766A9|nr:rhamnulokinase [Paenibacillus faecis]GIO84056.1 rhamnulokinase [Paenibacillus faecis]